MTPLQMMTCTAGCASGLREDNRHGVIYGPYWGNSPDGTRRFLSRLEWAAYADECVYCRAQLPRGRAVRITRKLQAKA
jgi:hypothetical protein